MMLPRQNATDLSFYGLVGARLWAHTIWHCRHSQCSGSSYTATRTHTHTFISLHDTYRQTQESLLVFTLAEPEVFFLGYQSQCWQHFTCIYSFLHLCSQAINFIHFYTQASSSFNSLQVQFTVQWQETEMSDLNIHVFITYFPKLILVSRVFPLDYLVFKKK